MNKIIERWEVPAFCQGGRLDPEAFKKEINQLKEDGFIAAEEGYAVDIEEWSDDED